MLRRQLRDQRVALSKSAQRELAQAITQQVLQQDFFLNALNIGYYYPDEGEVDTQGIASAADQNNKQLYLPVLHSNKEGELKFYRYMLDNPLVKNVFGIEEPEALSGSAIVLWDLDVLFAPLVAFDERCDRIGRGAGYYDKTLAFVNELPNEPRPILVGLAYEFQKIPIVSPNVWDVPMDYIVTENTIYSRK